MLKIESKKNSGTDTSKKRRLTTVPMNTLTKEPKGDSMTRVRRNYIEA